MAAAPALIDDLIIEILLRLLPDDIACLARASLVCKTWRRLLSDRIFLRLYREVHGATPLLGFLYNNNSNRASGPLFIPTTPASPFSQSASSAGRPTFCRTRTLECRHGRVLLHHPAYYPSTRFTVWDPITGRQRCFNAPVHPYVKFTAAVLCASNGCDHLDCSDGPFLVVLVAKTRKENPRHLGVGVGVGVEQARASLYSSETGKWSVSDAIDLYSFRRGMPSLLAGDALFFLVEYGRVFKYDLTSRVLSAIRVPLHHVENMILCTAEDGGLGVAAVEGCSRLRLVSGRANLDGITEWVQGRVIELDSMITSGIGDLVTRFYVVGFEEGTSYIFIRANDSIFSVDLKSGRISKIGHRKFGPIYPLMGFYNPDLASARLQVPMRVE